MKVIINNREISIFRGATVRDAVMAYSLESYLQLQNGQLIVTDRFNNHLESDGALSDGQYIKLIKSEK